MIVRVACHAMGTRFEIVLAGDDEHRLRAAGQEALEEIQDCDHRLSLFRPDSFLSHINANAASRHVQLDDETFELLAECLQIHRASGGAFDITVAPLMRAWGFHGHLNEHPRPSEIAPVGSDAIILDHLRRNIRFARHGLALDLGGVAKGHALDAAAALLRDCGIRCALLHGGTSTVVAIGAPPHGQGWHVALRSEGDCPVVTLRDAALSVSAPHGRMIDVDGQPFGHVMNPATNAPAHGTYLAAVIAPTARRADAWSTALLVLGDKRQNIPDDLTVLTMPSPGNHPLNYRLAGRQPDLFSLPTHRHPVAEMMS